jgi:branched-chain amino acid transport system substrate-binding protein
MLHKRNILVIGVIAILVLVMAVPTLANEPAVTNQQSAQEGEPLKIGVLTDHSGALAIYGFEQTQGFMLGLEYATDGTMEVAGRPLEVIERDNASDIDTANSDARELIEVEGVEVLQGTVSSTVTLALQAAAEEYGIVLMAGPAASPAITGDSFNEYTFRACRQSFQDSYAVATYALEEYGNNYVQMAVDNAFGTTSAGAFDIVLQSRGATPVQDTILVAEDTTDFTLSLEAVRESGADFWVLTWAGGSTVTLNQQIAALGILEDVPSVLTTNSNDIMVAAFGDESLLPLYESATYFSTYHYTLPGLDPDNPNPEVNEWLVEHHVADYDGDYPDLFTECGFASAQALVAALEISEGSTDPEDLIPALEGLEWAGPKGEYTLRAEDHQALVPMYIVTLADPTSETFEFYNWEATISGEDTAPPCLAVGRSSEDLVCPEGE